MAEIKSMSLGSLHQEEDFGFHKIARTETVKCKDAKYVALHKVYDDAFATFDTALKQGGGADALSSPITAQDAVCDNLYRGARNQVLIMENHFDHEKAEIARQARLIFNKYGDPTALPYLEECGVIHNLIQELEILDNKKTEDPDENPDILSINTDNDRLQLIGVREWIDQLKIESDRFLALFTERNTQQSLLVTGASKVARQATDTAYRNVIKRLNALAEVNGEADYLDIINALNTLIDRQNAILASRKTKNANKKKENPDEKPDIL